MTESLAMMAPRRVTVVAPHTRVDLALPAQATVGEVVAQVVELIGIEQLDPTSAADGWLLGRLGETPLDASRSILSADVHDGDLLHLHPRSSRVPPALFDDVIDAIAQAATSRPDRWSEGTTRTVSFVLAGCMLAAGAVSLATLGAGFAPTWEVAALTAALLVIVAAFLSRAVGSAAAGLTAGLGALPYAYWAGADNFLGNHTALRPPGSALLVGAAAVALTTAVAAVAVGRYRAVFGAISAISVIATLGGAAVAGLSARPVSVAALIGALATSTLPWLPFLSVRLARLPLPVVPVDVAEFRRDDHPIEEQEMIGQARRGDIVLTWILVALAATVLGCLVVLWREPGTWPKTLAGCLCGIFILRARRLNSRPQRLALLVPGLIGLAAVAVGALAAAEPIWRVFVVPCCLAGAALLIGYALRSRKRGASPYLARLADVVDFLLVAALLPLTGAVLGLYARMRGLGG